MRALIRHETRHAHLNLVLAVKKRLGLTPARDERRNGQDAQRLGASARQPGPSGRGQSMFDYSYEGKP
ncbi:hypothetical protein HD841_000562 [Sphingomonas melonis]|uniref:Uncharacterized protein n=1 Tax=Sphingomonas melonis TaxID=152682 RepID=A0A7Y9FK53_9SPHN|nr:hypothetical protein [Sphingomonas melonis]